jgi:biopolymer transport protein ExbD
MGLKRKIAWTAGAVVLLLLIAVPIATVRIKIDLPPAAIPKPLRRVDVFVGIDGSLRVGDTPSSLDTLTRDVAAQSATPDRTSQQVRVHTPKSAPDEMIIAALKSLHEAGWSHVGLINEP